MTLDEQRALPWILDTTPRVLERLAALLPRLEAAFEHDEAHPDIDEVGGDIADLSMRLDKGIRSTRITVSVNDQRLDHESRSDIMLSVIREILKSPIEELGHEQDADADRLNAIEIIEREGIAFDADCVCGSVMEATPLGTGGLHLFGEDGTHLDVSPRWCVPGRISVDMVTNSPAHPALPPDDHVEHIYIEAVTSQFLFNLPDPIERMRLEAKVAAKQPRRDEDLS